MKHKGVTLRKEKKQLYNFSRFVELLREQNWNKKMV